MCNSLKFIRILTVDDRMCLIHIYSLVILFYRQVVALEQTLYLVLQAIDFSNFSHSPRVFIKLFKTLHGMNKHCKRGSGWLNRSILLELPCEHRVFILLLKSFCYLYYIHVSRMMITLMYFFSFELVSSNERYIWMCLNVLKMPKLNLIFFCI